MSEELVTECRRLLRDGLPGSVPAALLDRNDFIPLAVDVDGDVAAVALLCWWDGPPGRPSRLPQPRPVIRVWKFIRVRQEWIGVGGSGGTAVPEHPLAPRPAAAVLGGHLRRFSKGSTLVEHPAVRADFYIGVTGVRAAAEVDRVTIGARRIPLPWHGLLTVVWPGQTAPTIDALSPEGGHLATLGPAHDLSAP